MKYQIQYINSQMSNIQLSNIVWEVSNPELNTQTPINRAHGSNPPAKSNRSDRGANTSG